MLNWKKTLLPIAALAIAIPAAAYAATDNPTPAPTAGTAAPEAGTSAPAPHKGKGFGGMMDGHRGGKHHGGGHGFASGKGGMMDGRGAGGHQVHHSAYLGLLAEKYSPETAAEWNAALAEQTKLLGQLEALKPTDAEREAAHTAMEAKRKELDQKLKSGEITKEQLHQQLKEGMPGVFHKGTPKQPLTAEELEARKTLQTQFTDAVASKDAAKIKEALAALLTQQKKDNEQLAAKIAEIQASKAAAPQA